MKEYNHPINQRDNEELFCIIYYTKEWQDDAVEQAKIELKKRRITQTDIDKKFKEFQPFDDQQIEEHKKQLKRNAEASYSTLEKVQIFFASPLILLAKLHIDKSLFELKRGNYKLKFN